MNLTKIFQIIEENNINTKFIISEYEETKQIFELKQ